MSTRATWTKHRLDTLGFVGRGKSKHRPRNDPSLFGGDYPFFQTGDVKAARFKLSRYSQTYNEKGLRQSKLWDPGTLCITIAANIADTAILEIPGCFPDSVVGFVPNPKKSDARFIKYSIDALKARMSNISRGTTQDNLSLDKLLTFEIDAPLVDIQTRIADVISTYDELIENNVKRIKKLESIAGLYYAKAAYSIATTTTLGKKVQPKKGKNITKATIVEGSIPVVAGGLQPAYFHNLANTTGPVITVSASGANAGFVNMYSQDIWASDCSFIDSEITPHVYFYFTLLKRMQYAITHMQKGSAQPHVYPADLERLEIPDFSNDEIEQLSNVLNPIYELVGKLKKINDNLLKTQYLLLPRLMSGEIEV